MESSRRVERVQVSDRDRFLAGSAFPFGSGNSRISLKLFENSLETLFENKPAPFKTRNSALASQQARGASLSSLDLENTDFVPQDVYLDCANLISPLDNVPCQFVTTLRHDLRLI